MRRPLLALLALASVSSACASNSIVEDRLPADAATQDTAADRATPTDTGTPVDTASPTDTGNLVDTPRTTDTPAVVDSGTPTDATPGNDVPAPLDVVIVTDTPPGVDVPPTIDSGVDVPIATDAPVPTDTPIATDTPPTTDVPPMPATGFATTGGNWPVPTLGLSDGPYTPSAASGTRWWTLLDMDGDGRADLVQTGDPTRTGGYVFGAGSSATSWRVYLNTGSGFATTATTWAVPTLGLSDGPYTPSAASGTRWWSTFDIDGDRRPDLVQTGDPTRAGGYVFGAGSNATSWRVYLNTGSGFSSTATTWTVPTLGLSDGPYSTSMASGTRWWSTMDMDGDGRPDLVQTGDPSRVGGYVFGAGSSATSWRVYGNSGSGFATTAATWPVPSLGFSDGPYTTAYASGTRWWSTLDLNGDGRVDLVQTGDPLRAGGYVFGAGTIATSWQVFAGR